MSATPAIVVLLRGAEAHAAIHDADFITRWLTLLEHCPYATVYQRPEFVLPWYCTYRQEWEPVVLVARDASGHLWGLWFLAWNEERRALVHAGAHQAEYHTWLTGAGGEASFLEGAWTELRRSLSFSHLRFEYLPSPHLADLLQATLGTVTVQKRRRPLLRLDPKSIRASLAKKKTRYRFNRLGRLGLLEFRRIIEPAEFERVFDELISFYDFRQGATHSVTPFRTDPMKRAFHAALFAASPQRVVFTVTYLAGRPIAGCWAMASERQTHLGMVIHSPFLAEHSPGILHFMQLSEYLAQRGMPLIDLTPGGDAWKARFANDYDRVASAVLHASRWRWWSDETRAHFSRGGKRLLGTIGVTPDRARSALSELRRARPLELLRKARKWIWDSREVRIYRVDRSLALRHNEDPRVRCNSLTDLMLLQPADSSNSRHGLSAALARLEHGESAWTMQSDGSLAHCSWTAAVSESRLMEVDQILTLPPGSLLLHEVYSSPGSCASGLYRAALGHTLRGIFADESLQDAYISLPADDRASRHIIEAMGFSYEGSFYWQRRLGRVVKWADPPFREPAHA